MYSKGSALILIDSYGLMEASDAVRGCGLGPRVPLRMLVGRRGYSGAMAEKLPIDSAYTYTEPLLEAWGIPTWYLMSDDDLGVIGEMDAAAGATSMPAPVVTGYRFGP